MPPAKNMANAAATFTPGPWFASVERRTPTSSGYWYVVQDAEENGLGEFYGDDHEANVAHLNMAAAAPDMFKALRALSFAAQTTGGSAGRDDALVAAIDKAAAALAKARGEAR
jgi:hypothetical protein